MTLLQTVQNLRPDSAVRYLKGVGPERARLLEELGVRTVMDLLYFFPRRHENRAPVKKIGELGGGEEKECAAGRVVSAKNIRTKSGRFMFRAVLRDPGVRTGPALFVTWFNTPYLSGAVKPGTQLLLWGRAERSGSVFHTAHPEFEIAAAAGTTLHFGRIVPVYPLIEELTQKILRPLTRQASEEFSGRVPDRLPEDRRRTLGFPPVGEAVRAMHFPRSLEELDAARRRLVFDEFLELQLAVARRRAARCVYRPELSQDSGGPVVAEFVQSRGFRLTEGQRRAIDEITADMRRPFPMNRLLQADVGSGKTVVAAAAVLHAVSSGFQAAFMAPTEVLARQQMFSLSRDLEPFGARLAYFGQGVSSGAAEFDVAVGTHALLEKRVRFRNLGLAVIDEQHKFGVAQRAALQNAQGKPAHLLMLTATPIPRSLALTLYGDLDLSEIRETPARRDAVGTAWLDRSRREAVYAHVDKALADGGRAFVVCPLLSKGAGGVQNAVETAREISGKFPHHKTGCLHGRLKADEKMRLVRDFREGRIRILVSTVVIEVGIDVPDARWMVIENAERFGMAQLHQLRGRIGRDGREAFCFLISDASDAETQERLETFCRTASGFELAEKDLEIRGSGDLAGLRQHGWPERALGDFNRDRDLLLLARAEAERMLAAAAARG